jgi:beta-galactosidase
MVAKRGGHDHENEAVVERNRLQPRAHFLPKDCILLNGDWQFHFATSLNDAPAPPAVKPKASDGITADGAVKWQTCVVPGHWQLQSTNRDPPNYTNVQFPFPCDPPNVPQHNPIGTYVREVHVPASWRDISRFQVRLRFEGVDSAFHLWINQEQVGYSQGSRNAAEFDISKHLRDGPNTVCVRVYKWSDGSYIEDQDQWWLSGTGLGMLLLLRAHLCRDLPRCVSSCIPSSGVYRRF